MIVSASCISIRTQCYGWAAGSRTGLLRGNLDFPEMIVIFIPSEVGDIAYNTPRTVSCTAGVAVFIDHRPALDGLMMEGAEEQEDRNGSA